MNILITGASGLVATELTLHLLDTTDDLLLLVTRDKCKLEKRYATEIKRIKIYTLEEISRDSAIKFDVCVHTAFARSSDGREIASSLTFLQELCAICRNRKVTKFINISSQSVYGDSYTPGIKEDGDIAPSYLYALGKYASELICEEALRKAETQLFNIRLSSVCENARFIKAFVDNALKGMSITLTAPNQVVSFIDVRDVAEALCILILDSSAVPGIYNLGSGQWYTIKQIADVVRIVGEKYYGIKTLTVDVKDNGQTNQLGMNVDKIKSTFSFMPKYGMTEMIRSIFEMLTNVNGGGYPQSFKIVYSL